MSATVLTSGPSPLSLSSPFTPRDPEVDRCRRHDSHHDWPFTCPLTCPPSDVSPSVIIPLEKTLNLSTLSLEKTLNHCRDPNVSRGVSNWGFRDNRISGVRRNGGKINVLNIRNRRHKINSICAENIINKCGNEFPMGEGGGTWKFLDTTNGSSRFPDIRKTNGNSVIELVSTPTKISGVHYVQGVVIFQDVFDNAYDVGGAQIKIEGVYIWPFRQLRMVANRLLWFVLILYRAAAFYVVTVMVLNMWYERPVAGEENEAKLLEELLTYTDIKKNISDSENDDTLLTLVKMGYKQEEALIAIERLGGLRIDILFVVSFRYFIFAVSTSFCNTTEMHSG
ncbi:hypothetical protein Fmac_021026 [Flemingia macrophylla]|uniref:UBA domain-containing protein n=1 Tax=Flemingia macrophylla TaxID=520843 RepID=A0ABD1LVQ7_9FABA